MDTLSDSQKTQLETVNGLENKLVWAIYKGTADAVELFIEQGANVNWTDADGMIPLYKSGRDGKHEALEILIQHGANMEHDGDRGSTALYVAAQNGHAKCVEVLLKYGAYLESKFTGFYTPVYIASQKGNIVEMLIAHGANLEAPCPNGSTALFVASQNGHAKVVELLLANGANTEILFKAKTTPLEQAAGRGHKECVQLLLQYGAHFDPKKPELQEEEHPKKFVYCRKVLSDPKHPRPVKVLLAVDTTLYIAYSGEKNVIAFDTLSDQPVASFESHTDEVTCLATQGDILYSGSADKSIMCWDKNTGELLDTIKGHTEAITCILYHTYVEKDKQNFEVTRKILYSGSADKTVRGWEGTIRKVKFEGHKGPITCIYAKNFKIYSMSYDILYSASADGTVRANDIVTGQCLLEFIGHDGAILSMAEHDDILYTGSADNTIKCWDRLRGKCVHTFEGHTDSIRTMQIVDCILFTGSSDKTVKAWGVKTKKLHGSYEGHGGPITCSTISKDTLYTGSSDGGIRFWELGDKAHYIVGEKCHVYEHSTQDEIIHVKLVNDVLYTASQCELRAWDTKTNSLISSVKIPVDGISCLCVNPPKNKFFTGGSNQIISIWNLHSGDFIGKIPVLSPITCMLVPDDNNTTDDQLYTGFADSTVKSWDSQGKCLINFVGHTSRVNCIAIREGTLYTGSDDMTIKLWKRKTGEYFSELTAQDCVTCIAVDAELLFASFKNTVIGWSLKTKKNLSYAFEGHTKLITCLSVQGETLLSGSADKTIRKWDKKTGEVLHVFRGSNGTIGCMDMNTAMLYSGASDGTIAACIHKDDKLFWACHYGITALVKEAIEQEGKQLTAQDTLERTLLMVACAEGHTRLAEYLLSEGCTFETKNTRDQTALYFILKNHRWHLLHQLSNFYSSKYGKPLPLQVIPSTACEALLRERCSTLDKEFFRNLQKYGVEFDSSHIVGYAASLGLIEMVKFFIDEFKFDVSVADREGKTLMQNATENSQSDVVKFLNKFSQDISTLPDSQRGALTVLLEDQAKEFAKICENFQQMQRLFSSMQYSINTVVKNQEHISQLLRQPK